MKFLILVLAISGCGVKGDPKPPLTPAAMGHGQPSFTRAAKLANPLPSPDPETSPRKTNDDSQQE